MQPASFYSDETQGKKKKRHLNIKIIKTSFSLENLG